MISGFFNIQNSVIKLRPYSIVSKFKEKIGSKHLLNFSLYLFSSLFTALIGIVVNPFLAMGLSASDYAIIGYYGSFALILGPIITFSFSTYYARHFFLVEVDQRDRILNTLNSVYLAFGAIVFILFISCYYIYHVLFVKSIPFSPYAIISFLPTYFTSFYNLYLIKLRMNNNSKQFAKISIVNALLVSTLSIFFVYFLPFGAIGRLSVILGISVIIGVYSLYKMEFKFIIDKKVFKDALQFCWPLAIMAVLSYFFMGIDRAILEKINDTYSLGLYNVGLQIAAYFAIFGGVLMQTFDPDLYKATSLNNHRKVIFIILGVTTLCLIANLCFIIVSKPLIGLLTSGRYIDSAPYASVLCLRNVTTIFAYLLSNALVGYGYSKYELFNRIIGSVGSFLLCFYLIDKYGYIGAAWSQVISWFIMGIISCFCIIIMFKVRKT